MSALSGGGWGDVPSNDPEERGDGDGDGQRPGVNREMIGSVADRYRGGTDPGFGLNLGDPITNIDSLPVRTVDNLKRDEFPQSSKKRPERPTKGYAPGLG